MLHTLTKIFRLVYDTLLAPNIKVFCQFETLLFVQSESFFVRSSIEHERLWAPRKYSLSIMEKWANA